MLQVGFFQLFPVGFSLTKQCRTFLNVAAQIDHPVEVKDHKKCVRRARTWSDSPLLHTTLHLFQCYSALCFSGFSRKWDHTEHFFLEFIHLVKQKKLKMDIKKARHIFFGMNHRSCFVLSNKSIALGTGMLYILHVIHTERNQTTGNAPRWKK